MGGDIAVIYSES